MKPVSRCRAKKRSFIARNRQTDRKRLAENLRSRTSQTLTSLLVPWMRQDRWTKTRFTKGLFENAALDTTLEP